MCHERAPLPLRTQANAAPRRVSCLKPSRTNSVRVGANVAQRERTRPRVGHRPRRASSAPTISVRPGGLLSRSPVAIRRGDAQIWFMTSAEMIKPTLRVGIVVAFLPAWASVTPEERTVGRQVAPPTSPTLEDGSRSSGTRFVHGTWRDRLGRRRRRRTETAPRRRTAEVNALIRDGLRRQRRVSYGS